MLGEGARLPRPELLHEAFLWSEWRTVSSNTAQVSLFGNRFEVDAALAGRRIELVFDPFDLSDIEVRFDNRPMGRAVAVKIGRHTHPRARPEAAPVAVPSGIDYLALVAAKRERELHGAPIDYAALSDQEDQADEDGQHREERP
ncbi:MAG TPA: Mu transposase C-terminal domain-containing protein [Acidimicrobiales bacterium]|nr:Mu transposase C-terminal domain-containing protein [Acidimicrobiales bacterium]